MIYPILPRKKLAITAQIIYIEPDPIFPPRAYAKRNRITGGFAMNWCLVILVASVLVLVQPGIYVESKNCLLLIIGKQGERNEKIIGVIINRDF